VISVAFPNTLYYETNMQGTEETRNDLFLRKLVSISAAFTLAPVAI